MKGQPGLTGLERIGKIADTLLARLQVLENPNSCLIGQGMEEPTGSFSPLEHCGSHVAHLHQCFLICQQATERVFSLDGLHPFLWVFVYRSEGNDAFDKQRRLP